MPVRRAVWLLVIVLAACADEGSSAVPSGEAAVVTASTGGVAGDDSATDSAAGGGGLPPSPPDTRDRPPSPDELEEPSGPPELCLDGAIDASDPVGVVASIVGSEVATSVGGTDPSGRVYCTFGDADEQALVRVRVSDASSRVPPAEAFAELRDDTDAVLLDDVTVTVGRSAARFDDAAQRLVEVSVLESVALDDAAAAATAVAVLDRFSSPA